MTDTTVGVTFTPQSPPERLGEVARATEAAGIAQLWLWEDCFSEGGLTTAAAALAWTERLQVGVGLLPVPLRNPALAAMEIATVARIFPGRFVPALGHGVLDWMGQVGARAASPMLLLREYTTAVRALLHGQTVDVDGRYVHLDGVALDWPPATPPPLLVGGRGPRTVGLAGELSDGVILDAECPIEQVRDAFAIAVEAHSAQTAFDSVAFVAVEPSAPGLSGRIDELLAQYVEAGATTVVFHGTSDDPAPEPLIEALANRS